MSEGYLSPAEIVANLVKGLVADRAALGKLKTQLPILIKRVSKGERFIRGMIQTWDLPMPMELQIPASPIPVTLHPKPPGIAVIKGFPCPECDMIFNNPQGRGIHVKWKHRER